MKLASIITVPQRLIDRTNPLALGRRWMLRNAPTFWRASVLKILWYLILGYAVLAVLGQIVAASMNTIPPLGELLAFRIWVFAMAGIVLCGWIVSLLRIPAIDRRLPQVVSSLAIYTVFVYGLLILPSAYLAPVTGKILTLYDPQYLAEDKAAINNAFDELCDGRALALSPMRAAVQRLYVGRDDLEPAKRLIERIKVTGQSACILDLPEFNKKMHTYERRPFIEKSIHHMAYIDDFQHLLPTSKREATRTALRQVFKRDGTSDEIRDTAEAFALTDLHHTAQRAYRFSPKTGLERWGDGLVNPVAAMAAVFCAFVILALERISSPMAQAARHARARWKTLGSRKSRFGFGAFSTELLKNNPRLWIARPHIAVVLVVALVTLALKFWPLGDVLAYFFNELLSYIFAAKTAETISGLIIFGLFLASGILLIRWQAYNMRIDRQTPGAVLRALWVSYLPVYFGLFVFTIITIFFKKQYFPTIPETTEIIATLGASLYLSFVFFYIGMAFKGIRHALFTLALTLTFLILLALIVNIFVTDASKGRVLSLCVSAFCLLLFGVSKNYNNDTFDLSLCLAGVVLPFYVALFLDQLPNTILRGIDEITMFVLIIFAGNLVLCIILVPLLRRYQNRIFEPADH